MTINPACSMLGAGHNRPNSGTSDPEHQVTSPRTSTDQPNSNQAPPPTEQRASSTAKLDNVKESPVKSEGEKKQNRYDWEGSWAVEIGSIALGVIGFALLIGFLAKIHNTAYTSWQYTASPNTVVSIIVTITKAALLVSVSSCLSQLKWNQYGNSASAPLYHMQVIDQASRGPWGSVNVLWSGLKERRMNALIISGALITIITLAIDPFAQQILTFPLRTTLDFDEPAWIPSTNQYYAAKGYDDGYVIYSEDTDNWLPPSTLTSILSGLAQENSPPEPHCGSGNCTYPGFVTLGVCSHCEDITSKADQKCNVQGVPLSAEYISDNYVNCTYTSPSGFAVDLNPSDLSMMQYDDGRMFYYVEFWLSRLRINGSTFGIEAPIISFIAANQSETLMYAPHNRTDAPSRPSMTECVIYYCEKEYAPSNYSSLTQSNDHTPVIRTQQLIPYHHWGSDPGYKSYNGSLYPPNRSTTISGNSSYIVDQDISGPLEYVLSNIFNATFQPSNDGSQPGALSLASLLQNGNFSELLESMSTSITDRFRASSKGNRVHGQAHKVESFIDVRWPWIILPGCVILGSILLLLGTALVSKRQHAVLWKSSVLPLMMSCLNTAPGHEISSLQNVDEVQHVSKKIDITMDQSEGPLIFTEH